MAIVTDPVCGMIIETDYSAHMLSHGVETYHFCSPSCRERFAADPASFLGGRERSRLRPEPPHTTTGPFTAPKFGSAGSGGAELEPGPDDREGGPR